MARGALAQKIPGFSAQEPARAPKGNLGGAQSSVQWRGALLRRRSRDLLRKRKKRKWHGNRKVLFGGVGRVLRRKSWDFCANLLPRRQKTLWDFRVIFFFMLRRRSWELLLKTHPAPPTNIFGFPRHVLFFTPLQLPLYRDPSTATLLVIDLYSYTSTVRAPKQQLHSCTSTAMPLSYTSTAAPLG